MISRQLSHVMHHKMNGDSKGTMPKLVNAYYLILKSVNLKSVQKLEQKTSYYMQLQHSPSCQRQNSMARLVIPPLRIHRKRQRISLCPSHSSTYATKKKNSVDYLVLVSIYIINVRNQTKYCFARK